MNEYLIQGQWPDGRTEEHGPYATEHAANRKRRELQAQGAVVAMRTRAVEAEPGPPTPKTREEQITAQYLGTLRFLLIWGAISLILTVIGISLQHPGPYTDPLLMFTVQGLPVGILLTLAFYFVRWLWRSIKNPPYREIEQ